MQKELLFALGLELWTERQLYWLICCISQFEFLIMWKFMARNDYFLEKADIIIMVLSIQCFAYVLFRVDHITIIYSLLYINLFLFIAFLIFKHFTNKKREFEKELEKELKKEDELKKKE